MAEIKAGQLEFRVHGANEGDEVDAAVFASKLGTLVRALRAADAAQNGDAAHFYTIVKLHTSSPTAILREQPAPRYNGRFQLASGIDGFAACADAITVGSPDALRFGNCASIISKLAKGSKAQWPSASKPTFGYAEVWTANDNVVRVDPFLRERAVAAIQMGQPVQSAKDQTPKWFAGAVFGTFDGMLRAIDLRGAVPEIKLVLSAGGKEIDCVCKADAVETLRRTLNRRVRVTGRAIYDASSGLPRRVEVSDIIAVGEQGDFSKWRGAFKPFIPSGWPGDEN